MNLAVVEGKIVGMPRVFSVPDGAEQVALFRLDADGEDIPISVPLNATNTKANKLEPDAHALIRGTPIWALHRCEGAVGSHSGHRREQLRLNGCPL